MSPITTHVLDAVAGRPAAGLTVTLEYRGSGPDSGPNPGMDWQLLAEGRTDADGRIRHLLPDGHVLHPGLYQLRFDTSARSAFFPEVVLRFQISDPLQHYHVPLLLSPFSFTAYRGT